MRQYGELYTSEHRCVVWPRQHCLAWEQSLPQALMDANNSSGFSRAELTGMRPQDSHAEHCHDAKNNPKIDSPKEGGLKLVPE